MKCLLKVPGIHMKIAMKYSGAKNEISIESARHLYEISIESTRYPYEKCNEISWSKEWNINWKHQAFIWKVQWNILELRMKCLLKAPAIFMKSAMKYPEANNEISIMQFHWTSKHYTHCPPGRCLVFIIKVVTTCNDCNQSPHIPYVV